MKARLEQRLQELRKEFEAGQKMLADLDQQRATVQQTVLRISGAIQVLEEFLGTEASHRPSAPLAQVEQETPR
jgi:hypothetical protein